MAQILYNIIILPVQYLIQLIFSAVWLLTYNAGISIIAVSLTVNLLCLPLYKRADAMQEEEREKQEKMNKWISHIGKVFSGDERFMMRQAYYREQKYSSLSPLKGTISLLLQIPFLIAAYKFLSTLPVLKSASFWIFEDLSQPDGLIRIGTISVNVLPVLMTLFNFISSIIYTKGLSLRERIQPFLIAVIFLIFLYPCPSGLVFYWTLNNLFSLLKNVFMKKIKHPGTVAAVICALAGVFVAIWAAFSGVLVKNVGPDKWIPDKGHILFIAAAVVISFIPLLGKLIGKKKRSDISEEISEDEVRVHRNIWFVSSLLAAIIFGLLLPLSIVSSSPEEFVDFGAGTMPLDHVFRMLEVAAGIFLFWSGVVYLTADHKGKKILSLVTVMIPPVMLVDYMIFGKTFGTLSTDLLYSEGMYFSAGWQILNIASVCVMAVICIWVWKKHRRLLIFAYAVLTAAAAVLGFTDVVRVNDALAKSGVGNAGTLSVEQPLVLSRTGKNVVVIMLDRAVGALVPYILEERPELAEGFSDFTYYPETISFGAHTNFGAPELFGGYEYTPESMNARGDVLLRDKHDEAITLLPRVFSEEGMHVAACDLPYVGYYEKTVDDVFGNLDNVDYHTLADGQCADMLTPEEKTEISASGGGRDWRFFMYGVMKSLPVSLQSFVYSKGKYMSVTNIPTEYLNQYAVMENLDKLTKLTDDASGCAVVMNNEITHETVTLQMPDYEYSAHPDNRGFEDKWGYHASSSWHTQMRAFMCLNKWFDHLKKEGVYDNTRIILVSDHALSMGECILEDGYDAQIFLALLMVKDFNDSSDVMTVSDDFMTIADVPYLAVNGIVTDAVNPYTGKNIEIDTEQKKHPYITSSENYVITDNKGYVFDTRDDDWYTVDGPVYDPESWTNLGPDNAAE